jgi:ApaG protein
MSVTFAEIEGLRATVDRVKYVPHLDAPADKPFPFVYFITIHNDSEETVTIKGRKWVVTDTQGGKVVVEGDGVVGKYPRLTTGESFSYNSYHVVSCDSAAEGAFIGLTDDNRPVLVPIPRFEMKPPMAE